MEPALSPPGWILSTITDEVSDLVISTTTTAAELWRVIHALFHDNKHARAMQLEHQFRTTIKGSMTMATYCQTLRNIADWLDDVDAPVSESQLVLQMLRGLPDDLQAQTSFLQFQQPLPTFLQTRSALLLLERQRQTIMDDAGMALMAGRTGSSPYSGSSGGFGRSGGTPGSGHNGGSGGGRGQLGRNSGRSGGGRGRGRGETLGRNDTRMTASQPRLGLPTGATADRSPELMLPPVRVCQPSAIAAAWPLLYSRVFPPIELCNLSSIYSNEELWTYNFFPLERFGDLCGETLKVTLLIWSPLLLGCRSSS
ncbi:hypothetical protein DM860_014852 [Cuscuta australis]|uniref:Retrotransposon gag domain-containing protein n=1 Tax=Cuscuta australis TaxID=267555 RepID=A0A328DN61_9ASTE|nr:hypothetical protein DM860_014852 [Cuscuta australis]